VQLAATQAKLTATGSTLVLVIGTVVKVQHNGAVILVWAIIPEVGQAHSTVTVTVTGQCPQPHRSWQVKYHKLFTYVGFDAVAGPAHMLTVGKAHSVHIADHAVVKVPQAVQALLK
jgi:hypothetical protein